MTSGPTLKSLIRSPMKEVRKIKFVSPTLPEESNRKTMSAVLRVQSEIGFFFDI